MLSSDPEDVRLLFPDLSSDVHHAPSLINRSSRRATASCLPLPTQSAAPPARSGGGRGGAPPPPDRAALRCTWILYLDPAPSSLSLQACYPSTTRLKRVRCLISVLKGCSFIGPSIVICTYASSERTTALAPPSNPNKT